MEAVFYKKKNFTHCTIVAVSLGFDVTLQCLLNNLIMVSAVTDAGVTNDMDHWTVYVVMSQ